MSSENQAHMDKLRARNRAAEVKRTLELAAHPDVPHPNGNQQTYTGDHISGAVFHPNTNTGEKGEIVYFTNLATKNTTHISIAPKAGQSQIFITNEHGERIAEGPAAYNQSHDELRDARKASGIRVYR